MELIQKFIKEQTLMADFWIADLNDDICSIVNEGITIEKSKTYLNKYYINIILKEKAYQSIQENAPLWENKFPRAVITKGSGKVEAYILRLMNVSNIKDRVILKFVGKKDK